MCGGVFAKGTNWSGNLKHGNSGGYTASSILPDLKVLQSRGRKIRLLEMDRERSLQGTPLIGEEDVKLLFRLHVSGLQDLLLGLSKPWDVRLW